MKDGEFLKDYKEEFTKTYLLALFFCVIFSTSLIQL
jgi:hypothetical protein